MQCEFPDCKSNKTIFGYIDNPKTGETYAPFFCMKHWHEIAKAEGKKIEDYLA